ncbi:MAG: hypothetical protein ACP6IY_04790 [Promethearchaeia archaeon]
MTENTEKDNPIEFDNIKELFEEIKPETEEGEIITDMFYNSIKGFFELGFELAKNLNLELLYDKFKGFDKENNKKNK